MVVSMISRGGLLIGFIWAVQAQAILPQAVSPAVGPVGKQLQAAAVVVELEHGSCGPGCSTHVLANLPKIPVIHYQVGMYCPPNKVINYMAYYPKQQEPTVLVDQVSDVDRKLAEVTVKPFATNELVKICRESYGGEWSKEGIHSIMPKMLRVDLKQSIYVSGSCTGWTDDVTRSFPVTLTVECHDVHEVEGTSSNDDDD